MRPQGAVEEGKLNSITQFLRLDFKRKVRFFFGGGVSNFSRDDFSWEGGHTLPGHIRSYPVKETI